MAMPHAPEPDAPASRHRAADATALDARKAERQARHTGLLDYGPSGVSTLAAARIVVIGAGGLGCPALRALASMEPGTLTIVDHDTIERSNLARQTLFTEADLGRSKAGTAAARLAPLAPLGRIRAFAKRLTEANAEQVLAGADLVLDTTDEWTTRFLVADTCHRLGLPLVWGSVLGWDGLLTTFTPGGPTIDDLVDRAAQLAAPPRECASAGVFAPLTAEVGAAMAAEAVRLLLRLEPAFPGLVRTWDAKRGRVRDIAFARRVVTDPPPVSAPAPPDFHGPAAPNGVPRLTPEALDAGTVIVDVRPSAHGPLDLGAPNRIITMPLETIAAASAGGRLDELIPLDHPLAIACAIGPRARHAAELLREYGADAAIIDGGIPALVARFGTATHEGVTP